MSSKKNFFQKTYHLQLCDLLRFQLQAQEIEGEQIMYLCSQQVRFEAIVEHLKSGLVDCSFLKKKVQLMKNGVTTFIIVCF